MHHTNHMHNKIKFLFDFLFDSVLLYIYLNEVTWRSKILPKPKWQCNTHSSSMTSPRQHIQFLSKLNIRKMDKFIQRKKCPYNCSSNAMTMKMIVVIIINTNKIKNINNHGIRSIQSILILWNEHSFIQFAFFFFLLFIQN